MFVNIIQEKPPIIKGNIHQKNPVDLCKTAKENRPCGVCRPKSNDFERTYPGSILFMGYSKKLNQ